MSGREGGCGGSLTLSRTSWRSGPAPFLARTMVPGVFGLAGSYVLMVDGVGVSCLLGSCRKYQFWLELHNMVDWKYRRFSELVIPITTLLWRTLKKDQRQYRWRLCLRGEDLRSERRNQMQLGL